MTNKETIKFGIETLEYMRDNYPYMDDERKQALNFVIKALEEQPTGEWERDDEHSITFDIFKCSHCGGWGATYFRFCPNCGAKMKGGEGE